MHVVRAAAWAVLLVLGSLAAAGLVVSLDHPASGDARPELAARQAAVLAPRLVAIEPQLLWLAAAEGRLAEAGREVLVRLRALDTDATSSALARGDESLTELLAAVSLSRSSADSLLHGLDEGSRLTTADRERIGAIEAALAAADGLPGAWAEVARLSVPPMGVLRALDTHDGAVVEAAAQGREERYADALVALDRAAAAFGEARRIRDAALSAGRDTATLDGWLARLADYDTALRRLYTLLEATDSVRTPEVDRALQDVEAAQGALPPTPDALVIAVTDLGAGDITPLLLTMEEVRGTLDLALAG